jgi:hypothetical protein
VAGTRPPPYVGVSGVITPGQQEELEQLAVTSGLTGRRILLLGVKAVHKTQFLDVENKYGPEWYPVGADAFTAALEPRPEPGGTLAVAQLYLDVDHVADAAYRDAFMARVRARP